MVSDGCFDFVGGVVGSFETPRFRVVYGALWWDGFVVGSGFGVVRGRVIGSGVMGSGVMRSGMMGSGVGSIWCWGIGIMDCMVDRGGSIRIDICGCGAVSLVSVRCWGRGVPMSVVDDSMTSRMVGVGVGTGISAGHGNQSGNDHQFHLRVY